MVAASVRQSAPPTSPLPIPPWAGVLYCQPMCLRPDIVYVISGPVFRSYCALLDEGHIPCTRGFHRECEENEQTARRAGDTNQVCHWQMVCEFALRYGCNGLAALEIDGQLRRECEIPSDIPDSALTRVVIRAPRKVPLPSQA